MDKSKNHWPDHKVGDVIICTKDGTGDCVYCVIDHLNKRVGELIEYNNNLIQKRRELAADLHDKIILNHKLATEFHALDKRPPNWLRNLQSDQLEWEKKQPWFENSEKRLGNAKYFEALAGITEETGELAHSLLKMFQGIRGSYDEHEKNAKDAVGDITIFILKLCSIFGWDYQDIIKETWDEVKQRDFNKDKQNGTGLKQRLGPLSNQIQEVVETVRVKTNLPYDDNIVVKSGTSCNCRTVWRSDWYYCTIAELSIDGRFHSPFYCWEFKVE